MSSSLLKNVPAHSNQSGRKLNTGEKHLVIDEEVLEIDAELVEEAVLKRANHVCESRDIIWIVLHAV